MHKMIIILIILFLGQREAQCQENKFAALSMDIYVMPYSFPTGGLSNYFGPNFGGVGLGVDYFWNKHFGLVNDFFLSGQSYPKNNFTYQGGNWSTTHYVTLLHLNSNISPYIFANDKHMFYPYIGTGFAWLRTDGDKNDNLPKVNFGATPELNIGVDYAYLPLKLLSPILKSNSQRISIKVEYKQLFYSSVDSRFNGGLFHITLGYGAGGIKYK